MGIDRGRVRPMPLSLDVWGSPARHIAAATVCAAGVSENKEGSAATGRLDSRGMLTTLVVLETHGGQPSIHSSSCPTQGLHEEQGAKGILDLEVLEQFITRLLDFGITVMCMKVDEKEDLKYRWTLTELWALTVFPSN